MYAEVMSWYEELVDEESLFAQSVRQRTFLWKLEVMPYSYPELIGITQQDLDMMQKPPEFLEGPRGYRIKAARK